MEENYFYATKRVAVSLKTDNKEFACPMSLALPCYDSSRHVTLQSFPNKHEIFPQEHDVQVLQLADKVAIILNETSVETHSTFFSGSDSNFRRSNPLAMKQTTERHRFT
jgi:hypothetical protein